MQQIEGLALPSFIRVTAGDWRTVLVGPYATREEAVDVQRALDDARLTGSRTVAVGTTDPASRRNSAAPRWRSMA